MLECCSAPLCLVAALPSFAISAVVPAGRNDRPWTTQRAVCGNRRLTNDEFPMSKSGRLQPGIRSPATFCSSTFDILRLLQAGNWRVLEPLPAWFTHDAGRRLIARTAGQPSGMKWSCCQ